MAITIDPQYSKRFRRPKTLSYWGERDGLFLGKHGQQHLHMHWHFFQEGDLVEFRDPKREPGVLTQRSIIIEVDSHHESDYGRTVHCLDFRAYIMLGGKKVRVTEAPIMRLVRK